MADLIVGFTHQYVLKCLEDAQGDRVLKVRQAALLAKQSWQLVKVMTDKIDDKKTN